jgi:hypothetical protein
MKTTTTIIVADYRPSGRKALRARTVDLDSMIADARASAARHGSAYVAVALGGSTGSCYAWPASSEGAVVVAMPNGSVVAWAATLPARHATHSGVVAHCVGEAYRALRDDRYSVDSCARAEAALIALAESELAAAATADAASVARGAAVTCP